MYHPYNQRASGSSQPVNRRPRTRAIRGVAAASQQQKPKKVTFDPMMGGEGEDAGNQESGNNTGNTTTTTEVPETPYTPLGPPYPVGLTPPPPSTGSSESSYTEIKSLAKNFKWTILRFNLEVAAQSYQEAEHLRRFFRLTELVFDAIYLNGIGDIMPSWLLGQTTSPATTVAGHCMIGLFYHINDEGTTGVNDKVSILSKVSLRMKLMTVKSWDSVRYLDKAEKDKQQSEPIEGGNSSYNGKQQMGNEDEDGNIEGAKGSRIEIGQKTTPPGKFFLTSESFDSLAAEVDKARENINRFVKELKRMKLAKDDEGQEGAIRVTREDNLTAAEERKISRNQLNSRLFTPKSMESEVFEYAFMEFGSLGKRYKDRINEIVAYQNQVRKENKPVPDDPLEGVIVTQPVMSLWRCISLLDQGNELPKMDGIKDEDKSKFAGEFLEKKINTELNGSEPRVVQALYRWQFDKNKVVREALAQKYFPGIRPWPSTFDRILFHGYGGPKPDPRSDSVYLSGPGEYVPRGSSILGETFTTAYEKPFNDVGGPRINQWGETWHAEFDSFPFPETEYIANYQSAVISADIDRHPKSKDGDHMSMAENRELACQRGVTRFTLPEIPREFANLINNDPTLQSKLFPPIYTSYTGPFSSEYRRGEAPPPSHLEETEVNAPKQPVPASPKDSGIFIVDRTKTGASDATFSQRS